MREGRFLLLVAALILLPSVFLRPARRQQELRVLVTARNMVDHADPLRFEFQNQPRYRKPPLAYWCAAIAQALTGQRTHAWASRLPFAAAALGCVALLLPLGGPAGPWAATLFLLSHGFWTYAPLAETDFLQLSGLMLAVWAGRNQRGLLAGLGMTLALLAKGPAGIAIPLGLLLLTPAAAKLHLHPHLPSPPARFWAGALLPPLLGGGAWLLFLHADPTARAALARELSDTFLSSPHAAPLPYYLYTLPLLMLPGLLLALPALSRRPSPLRSSASPDLLWLGLTLFLLTLPDSKQRHYALLLLPPACLLLGHFLQHRGLRLHPPLLLAAALLLGLAEGIRTHLDPWKAHERFLHAARPLAAPAATLHVVGINSAFFDFQLGRHVENLDSAREALRRARPGEAVLLVQKRELLDIAPPPSPNLDASSSTWIRQVQLP